MSAVDIYATSPPLHESKPQFLGRPDGIVVNICVELYLSKTKLEWNIESLLRKLINLIFIWDWNSQYVSLSTLNLAFI
jgi:hypothetical protein